jgi:hypothetical protein
MLFILSLRKIQFIQELFVVGRERDVIKSLLFVINSFV